MIPRDKADDFIKLPRLRLPPSGVGARESCLMANYPYSGSATPPSCDLNSSLTHPVMSDHVSSVRVRHERLHRAKSALGEDEEKKKKDFLLF